MKRLLSVVGLVLSFPILALTPIERLEPGRYVGGGEWLSRDGNSGVYKDFIIFNDSGWTSINFSLEKLYAFDTQLKIDKNGFVYVYLRDVSDPANILEYKGQGHCGSYYCEIEVALKDGILRNMFMFNKDKSINIIGSISFKGDSTDVYWEGTNFYVP